MDALIASAPPVGYWIEDGRGKWMGPFDSEARAVQIGRMMAPTGAKNLKLVVLGQFEVRQIALIQSPASARRKKVIWE
jgi:hypothetical protein